MGRCKKNDTNLTHHKKKRTLKAKCTSATVRSKTAVDRDKSNVLPDTAAEARIPKTAADTKAKAAESKRTDEEHTESKATANKCTEKMKSKASAEERGAVETAATAGEGDDKLSHALPQSFAAPTRKPNTEFIDSVNSFRYAATWYPPSKVLP